MLLREKIFSLLLNNLKNMKKIFLFVVLLLFVIWWFLFYADEWTNKNIYENQISEIEKIISDTSKTQEMKSAEIMNIMINIYAELDWVNQDMFIAFEKVIEWSIYHKQYLDIQVLLHFYDLSKVFWELNKFEKLKNNLIEQNLVFSFHDNILLTKENVEETLRNR